MIEPYVKLGPPMTRQLNSLSLTAPQLPLSSGESRRLAMCTWTLVIGLLFLSGASVAQEYVGDREARVLLQLPHDARGDSVAITKLRLSPDSNSIALGASDGSVRIVTIADGSERRLARLEHPTGHIEFSPDGTRLAAGSFFILNPTGIGQINDQKAIDKLPLRGCVAFSPDGKLLAVGNSRGDATVVDVSTGETRLNMNQYAGVGPVDTGLYKPRTLTMDFSRDGSRLAVTTDFFDDELPRFQNVQVWDMQTRKLRFFLRGTSCGFSPTGDLLAYREETYDRDGRVVLLDIETFLTAGVLTGRFQDARFAPDNRTMAATSRQHVELWTIPTQDARTRRCERNVVLQHPTDVTSLAFAPDGRSLVTGDEDGTIRLWILAK
ncbi:MAG: hypothetical protein U0941_07455 [Planctomycetaceae bacterium]